jgi:hypothetical protein
MSEMRNSLGSMRRIAAFAALSTFLVLGLAGTAPANECSEACSDARQTCMKARRLAHHSCKSGCRETILETVASARAVCERESLEPKQCRELVMQTLASAQRACRADCRTDGKLERAVCQAERQECREVCSDAIDPACKEPCVDAFRSCREELVTCTDTCRSDAEAAIQACHDAMSDVCDPQALRECLHEVRRDARACGEECHLDTGCGPELRECVGDCVEDLDETPDV